MNVTKDYTQGSDYFPQLQSFSFLSFTNDLQLPPEEQFAQGRETEEHMGSSFLPGPTWFPEHPSTSEAKHHYHTLAAIS